MSNVFGFVSEESFLAKMNEQNILLAAIANGGGDLKPASWRAVQGIVRAGLAPKVFAVGDQFVCQKGGENGTTLVWDVIGFDHDSPANDELTHSMTLQLHDIYTNMMFDTREAFYYCASALPAGTYKFSITAHSYVQSEVGKTYKFTTTVDIPVGGQLVFKQAYDAPLQNASIDTFANASSNTPLETVIMTESATGINLGSIGNSIDGNFNSMQRALTGNNRWKESEIRQFLNSDKEAGFVWSSQNHFDRPPTWVSTQDGFLRGMDNDFLSVIGAVKKTIAKNTVCDGGGFETTNDKFFLISKDEVYSGQENNINEGGPYAYYDIFSTLSAAGAGSDANRIKYDGDMQKYWWLRSPAFASASSARCVTQVGAISAYYLSSLGVVPACNVI